ncbi:MAG: hypothetical protein L6275_02085, partial [Candidatus Portnoybacteria bacterium]|nr:hypothetical protein [Candidatus Portnoybacteria bacterium]
ERGLDLLPIEVKFISKKNIIPTGLRGFIEKFHPKKALVVNFSLSNNGVAINNTKINFIYPFELNHDQLLRTN